MVVCEICRKKLDKDANEVLVKEKESDPFHKEFFCNGCYELLLGSMVDNE